MNMATKTTQKFPNMAIQSQYKNRDPRIYSLLLRMVDSLRPNIVWESARRTRQKTSKFTPDPTTNVSFSIPITSNAIQAVNQQMVIMAIITPGMVKSKFSPMATNHVHRSNATVLIIAPIKLMPGIDITSGPDPNANNNVKAASIK